MVFHMGHSNLINLTHPDLKNFSESITERLFGKNWREVDVDLHQDSTFMWYEGSKPEGGILLKEAPEMIAVGQVKIFKDHF